MKRKMINVTGAVRPVDSSIRVCVLGLERVVEGYEDSKCLVANDGVEISVIQTDELLPEILFINDAENSAWIKELNRTGYNYDIRGALAEYCIENENAIFSAANRVYIPYTPAGEADYTEQSVLIRSGRRGAYFFGDSAYVDNSDIHITKYVSYETNNNKHIRKTFTTLLKGNAFSKEDFCQLLLNRRKRRSFGDEEYEYTRCTLYTNKFIYDSRNGNIVITVNDKRYLITRHDMFFNELYVIRLLTAASAGDLEQVIVDKYPSVLVHALEESIMGKKIALI
ncbi:MAG: hypothetical protein MJ133_01840 [Lachnospiraceae bacterium]|nr:hypothetical protein [Lachnospiraceae bacterium]